MGARLYFRGKPPPHVADWLRELRVA